MASSRLRALFFVLWFACCVVAQQVRIANHSPWPWDGWARATIDQLPASQAGATSDAAYRVGRQIGEATWIVDVRCVLAAGERKVFDLSTFAIAESKPPVLPSDLVKHFGALLPVVNNTAMSLVDLRVDGAAWLAQFRARVLGTRMLAVDLWVWWYPDQPGWCHGEALVTCSNPAVPDMGEPATTPAVTLSWGDAVVWPLGGVPGQLLAAGSGLVDGQAAARPLTIAWGRHMPPANKPDELVRSIFSLLVARDWQLGTVGVRQLLFDGSPSYGPSFTPAAMVAKFGESVRRLWTWDVPLYGPAIRSGDTGDQEDQTFVRGEALLPGGEGCELVGLWAALKLHGERPCNHLDVDGSPLEPANHPQLLFWDGRPHRHEKPPGVFDISPDQLGKPRALTLEEAHGRSGPDIEHTLANTLAASCRLTGSPSAMRLLRNMAVVYLLQRTEPPSWSVSTEGNWTRALGWEGIFVVHCWRDLEDRPMANRVANRWRTRVGTLIVPKLDAAPNDIWDVRDQVSASVPIPPGWMPWQQAIAAYGLDLGCRVLGPAQGIPIALRGARRVVADTWVREGNRWVEYERLSLAGDRSRSGFFAQAWLPCAVAVVLRGEPTHEKALSIWAQLVADTADGDRRWIPPGVK